MTTLIGVRCKHCKVLSRDVLITRILLGNLETTSRISANKIECHEWNSIRIIRSNS